VYESLSKSLTITRYYPSILLLDTLLKWY